MDLNYTGDTTSGTEGIDLLSRVQAIDSSLPIVVMTGWGSVDLAVEAMRRGVRDFVQKPWDNALLATLRRRLRPAGSPPPGRRRPAGVRRSAPHPAEAPAHGPPLDGCEIAIQWQPAAGVGGDCFDTISFGPNRSPCASRTSLAKASQRRY